jgi:hypothetical protein
MAWWDNVITALCSHSSLKSQSLDYRDQAKWYTGRIMCFIGKPTKISKSNRD